MSRDPSRPQTPYSAVALGYVSSQNINDSLALDIQRPGRSVRKLYTTTSWDERSMTSRMPTAGKENSHAVASSCSLAMFKEPVRVNLTTRSTHSHHLKLSSYEVGRLAHLSFIDENSCPINIPNSSRRASRTQCTTFSVRRKPPIA
ncbi:hypothetical protein U1Q18_044785 [Sarracenia purpurea var. burkii]